MRQKRSVRFVVLGQAQPKGSLKGFVPKAWAESAHHAGRSPRVVLTADRPSAKAWELLVRHAAQQTAGPSGSAPFLGPVVLTLTFWLNRPVSLSQKIRHHLTKPDLDKLTRTVADALTGVLYLDDKQIVDLHARKLYAPHGHGPQCVVVVEDAEPPALEHSELTADGSLFA